MASTLLARIQRSPLLFYFSLVYLLSAVALVVIGLPKLDGGSGGSLVPLVMFPVMVVGVGLIGVALTVATAGKPGVHNLRTQVTWPSQRRWLLVLLIPPVGICTVLSALRAFLSPNFAPQFLVFGFAAGFLAGFFEEIGWTGFAYPRMRSALGPLGGALVLGVLWGLWHLPVVDSLGAASPHGRYWPAFFASFVAMVVALRVLIAWVYNETGSLLMAQMLHASSTGFLVVLSASRVSSGQEALWYFAYAGVLTVVGIVVVAIRGSDLRGRAGDRLSSRRAHSSSLTVDS